MPRYSNQKKKQVQEAVNSGMRLADAAKTYGVSLGSVRNWTSMNAVKADHKSQEWNGWQAKASELEAENKALKQLLLKAWAQ